MGKENNSKGKHSYCNIKKVCNLTFMVIFNIIILFIYFFKVLFSCFGLFLLCECLNNISLKSQIYTIFQYHYINKECIKYIFKVIKK